MNRRVFLHAACGVIVHTKSNGVDTLRDAYDHAASQSGGSMRRYSILNMPTDPKLQDELLTVLLFDGSSLHLGDDISLGELRVFTCDTVITNPEGIIWGVYKFQDKFTRAEIKIRADSQCVIIGRISIEETDSRRAQRKAVEYSFDSGIERLDFDNTRSRRGYC